MMYYDGWMGGFGFGWVFMAIFWVVIAMLIIGLIRGGHRGCCGHGHWFGNGWDGSKDDEAMKILRERFTKGEITKDQFEDMKKNLEK